MTFKGLLALLLISPALIFAQNNEPCHYGHVMDQKMQQDPAYAQEVQQFIQEIPQKIQQYKSQRNGARAVRTVSVVVHVVYNTQAQNVSQTFVNNMISTLNEDFRRQNSDLGSTRNDYVSIAGDSEIEFCLDQTLRVNTSNTCFDPNTESNDMKFASSGGSNAVNTSEFLNIWIVNLCGNQFGGTAGYAYLPTQGVIGSTVDGLVIDYDLGFNQGFGRTATHEIGHYFGLQHPWGSDANPSCNVDDNIQDTPNTDGPNYTCQASNSCGTPAPGDMYENFMDYAGACSNMFTQGQTNLMNSVLTQSRSGLLNSSGCSSTPSAPIADFEADNQNICPGETVAFTDNSSGDINSWSWSFSGGTPSSSTQQNPNVTYNTPGIYDVTLTVNGPNGNDSETKTSYITVAASQNLPLSEGFQNNTFPSADWELLNFDNNTTWERTTAAGGYGQSSASAFVDNFNYDARGNQDVLLTPNYDFSNVSNAYLKYDYAYTYYDAQFSDTLIVAFTDDCGANYYLLNSSGGADLATAPSNTSAFTPNANQWETDSIDIGFLTGNANVQFAFINLNGYGNNLYLDNINIEEIATNAPPVANFSASVTTVNIGGTVNFTDLSSNAPTSWNWTFAGGTPNSSTQQNPSITYNTLGTYEVSLTAGNTFGNDTETKTAYINVVDNASGNCDTLQNFSNTDTITAIGTQQGGYISGHNGYGDVAKADFFQANAGDLLNEVSYFFAIGTQGAGTATITAKVWDADGTGGAPNTELASQSIALSDIVSSAGNNLITLQFPTPIVLNGDFYAGIEFTYGNGDTVALYTNLDGNTNPGTAWEKWNTGDWYNYNSTSSWGLNMSNVIIPVVCEPSVGNAPVADFSANNQSACEGASINFTDQSTNTPTSWSWTFQGGSPSSSSQENPSVTYNSAGTYEVSLTATNADGSDTKTESGFITITASPNISENITNLTCNGAGDGAITLSISGGSSPYSYAWSNGANSKDLSGLNSGNFSVTVTDNNGCISNESFTVTEPAALQITGNITNADCGQSNGSINVNVNGGAAPFGYAWSNGGSSAALNNLSAGNYTVTVTDNNNCTNSRTFSVSNTGAPSINILDSDISCGGAADGAARVEVTSGTPPFNFSWSNGSNDSLIQNLSAGNYDVTVTDGNNCIATGNAQITEPDTLEAIITGNNPTCGSNNGSLTLNPQGGVPPYSYTWNTGSSNLSLNNLSAGSYSVTLTDGNACQTINSYNLSAFNAPTLTLSSTDINCSGTGGDINSSVSGGNPPYSYNWSNGESSANLSGLTPGTYILTVSDNSGCVVTQLASISSEGPELSINKSDVLACFGDNTGSISLQINGGNPPYDIEWNTGQSSNNLNGLNAGSYSVSVTDDDNCQVVSSVNINQPDSLAVVFQSQDADAGQNNGSADVTVSGGTAPYAYNWSNGSTGNAISNLSPGTYSLTISDANACREIINFNIDLTNSIEDINAANSWNLYPNPANDVLYIKSENIPQAGVEIRIFSTIGAEVQHFSSAAQNTYRIDLNNYSEGVYFVELRYEKQRVMKRFVITR